MSNIVPFRRPSKPAIDPRCDVIAVADDLFAVLDDLQGLIDRAAMMGRPAIEIERTVQNLLDKKPPIVGNTIGSTTYNSGNTFPSSYDALGRRYAVSAKLKF